MGRKLVPSLEFIKQVGVSKWTIRYFMRQFYKRVLKKGISIELPTGLTYFSPLWDPSGSEVYVTNADVDWGSEKLMAEVLSKEGTFIDVGAHTGYYSLYMLPIVSWVYAFEPDAQSYDVLCKYSHTYENLFTFPYAVSNQSEVMEVQVKGGGYTFIAGTSSTQFPQKNEKKEIIKVVRLDDYIGDYKTHVTGIKIDVDGPDLDVLEGALETVDKFQPIILIELSSQELDRLFRLCEKIKYSVYAFTKEIGESRNTVFEQIFKNTLRNKKIKMMFLIPEHVKATFESYCKHI